MSGYVSIEASPGTRDGVLSWSKLSVLTSDETPLEKSIR